jgi:hypothetical protein
VDIASDAASGKDFDFALRFNVAEDLSVDFDLSDFDIGMYDRVLSNDQYITRGDRTMKVAIEADHPGKLQFTSHVRASI